MINWSTGHKSYFQGFSLQAMFGISDQAHLQNEDNSGIRISVHRNLVKCPVSAPFYEEWKYSRKDTVQRLTAHFPSEHVNSQDSKNHGILK